MEEKNEFKPYVIALHSQGAKEKLLHYHLSFSHLLQKINPLPRIPDTAHIL